MLLWPLETLPLSNELYGQQLWERWLGGGNSTSGSGDVNRWISIPLLVQHSRRNSHLQALGCSGVETNQRWDQILSSAADSKGLGKRRAPNGSREVAA